MLCLIWSTFFCQKAEIFHAPFIFYFFKVKTNKYMYNFGSFLNQMLDEKKKSWIFIQMFNEKFNVLWTFSMHSYLCDKNSHNVSMKRAGCLLSSLHRNKNPTCTVHMGENMFLGVKLICPRVVACVSSGNRIRMLWTNAHSLVHSFCRSGGIGGGAGADGGLSPSPQISKELVATHVSQNTFLTLLDFQIFRPSDLSVWYLVRSFVWYFALFSDLLILSSRAIRTAFSLFCN